MENGNITLTPQSSVDKHIAEGLEDARGGRTHGPYASAQEAVQALQGRAKPHAKCRV